MLRYLNPYNGAWYHHSLYKIGNIHDHEILDKILDFIKSYSHDLQSSEQAGPKNQVHEHY